MSPREQLQNEIVDRLYEYGLHTPYGILTGLESVGRGKVRTVTFCKSLHLDATLKIFSPVDLRLRWRTTHRELEHNGSVNFTHVDDFYRFVEKYWA